MLLVSSVRWATGQGDIWSHTSGSIHTTSLQLWRLISWDPYTAMGERRHLCQITLESLETGLNFYPQEKAVKERNLCQEWGQKVSMAGAWLKPTSFSSSAWVLLWVGWDVLAVLESPGEVPVPVHSEGIRALCDSRGEGTRSPLEGHPSHSGSLKSHEVWNQVFLPTPWPFLPVQE